MQHIDLSAQYGGQQGHSDVHAVLCLTEIRCPWVCVHLRTERKAQKRHKSKRNRVLAKLKYCTGRAARFWFCGNVQQGRLGLTWFHWLWAADASPPSSSWLRSWCEGWGWTGRNTMKQETETHKMTWWKSEKLLLRHSENIQTAFHLTL